jgi:hypothetical protein
MIYTDWQLPEPERPERPTNRVGKAMAFLDTEGVSPALNRNVLLMSLPGSRFSKEDIWSAQKLRRMEAQNG